jgi:hypothetical protein
MGQNEMSELAQTLPGLQARNRKLSKSSGIEKIEAYDQMENIADLAMPSDQNRIVTLESNRQKNPGISKPSVGVARSERSELAAMGLILLDFFDFKGIGVSQFVSQIVSQSPRGQTSDSSFNGRAFRHDKSRLKMAPIPSNAQST